MPESPDKDIEALEFLLDTLEHDLGVYQESLKKQVTAVDLAKQAFSQARKNLLYLKREAPVVKMSEYTTACNAAARAKEKVATAEGDLKEIHKQIKETQGDIDASRKTLQSLQSKVKLQPQTPTAKILEFKKNDSGRDPT